MSDILIGREDDRRGINLKTIERDYLVRDLNNLEQKLTGKMKAKDQEITELKTKLEDTKAECDLYLKQYRIFGRENRDQKKEIESLQAKMKSITAENLALKRKVLGPSVERQLETAFRRINQPSAAGLGQDQILDQHLDEDGEGTFDDAQGKLKETSRNINLAQMGCRIDSEMLAPPANLTEIPKRFTNKRPSSKQHDDNVALVQPRPRKLVTKASGARSRPKETKQSKMSHVLQKPRPWKCTSCSGYFTTIDYLRQHIKSYHPKRKHFCGRCPFSCDSERKHFEHEQDRGASDSNVH